MKKVLFVCIENSCRSQIAEAFANIHGETDVLAFSAGSRPSGTINPKAMVSMQEIGYNLSIHESGSLDIVPPYEYDYIIKMGCGDDCPQVRAKKHEDWYIPDPKDMDMVEFRKVRDLIESKTKDLLKRINK